MNISVILSTYKRSAILIRTLESFCSLIDNDITWEVIVVDNANDPETQLSVSKFAERIPIKCIVEQRIGKNCALNVALKLAKGELFVFTDDDVLADSNWLIETWQGSRRWPKFSVFGGRILPAFPIGKIPLGSDHYFFNSAYVIADWPIDEGPYKSSRVWGPNMAIAANIFRAGWRFNENIGPSGNNYVMGSETELLLRLEQAGFCAIYLKKSLVHHQIRPEQLSRKWLYGRAFRYGRSLALTNGRPAVVHFLNAPRFLYRNLMAMAVKRIRFFFDKTKSVIFGIEYHLIRGQIFQYREPLKDYLNKP